VGASQPRKGHRTPQGELPTYERPTRRALRAFSPSVKFMALLAMQEHGPSRNYLGGEMRAGSRKVPGTGAAEKKIIFAWCGINWQREPGYYALAYTRSRWLFANASASSSMVSSATF
jgi:hypothetical protein